MKNKTHERIYDAKARESWKASGLVEVRTLRKGDVFESRDGLFHTYDHNDGGTVRGKPWGHDEYDAHMVGTAMVRPIMRTECVK